MQPFGVLGGGAKNEQTIADLVAYIQSIQLTPDQSKKNAEKDLVTARKAADDQVAVATSDLADATKALADAHAQSGGSGGDTGDDSDADIAAQCNALADTIKNGPERRTNRRPRARRAARSSLRTPMSRRRRRRSWGGAWRDSRRRQRRPAALLRDVLRVATQGWSIFDPTQPNARVLGPAGAVAAKVAASASTCATATPNGGSVPAPQLARSASTRSSSSSSRLGGEQGLRQRRHRLRPHAGFATAHLRR